MRALPVRTPRQLHLEQSQVQPHLKLRHSVQTGHLADVDRARFVIPPLEDAGDILSRALPTLGPAAAVRARRLVLALSRRAAAAAAAIATARCRLRSRRAVHRWRGLVGVLLGSRKLVAHESLPAAIHAWPLRTARALHAPWR